MSEIMTEEQIKELISIPEYESRELEEGMEQVRRLHAMSDSRVCQDLWRAVGLLERATGTLHARLAKMSEGVAQIEMRISASEKREDWREREAIRRAKKRYYEGSE